MLKLQILQRIHQAGMVAIVRADSARDAQALAQACIEGGITVLEVAFTTPGTLDVIVALRRQYGDQALIGAGTVLDEATARMAILAGAQFIVSPGIDAATIRLCNRSQVASLPGAMTPTEILAALEAGADIVKVFPAEAFGPEYIKALLAPLPQAPLMPTGGITLDNMADWFKHGSVAVGIGSSLSAPAREGNYTAVSANARAFVQRLEKIRMQV
jgi:2-dehydro-3-deoxyphosphogluconate aldolase/(4S)-4-hydroxy-2-oxoglutarate aldolase